MPLGRAAPGPRAGCAETGWIAEEALTAGARSQGTRETGEDVVERICAILAGLQAASPKARAR
jgi:hypothetical protein